MKTILHLPTWFPDESRPISGLFTEKQISAISQYDAKRRHIVIPLTAEFIPITKPLLFFSRFFSKRNIKIINTEHYTVYQIDFFLSHKYFFGPISRQLQKQIERCIRQEQLAFSLIHAHVTYTGGVIAMELSKKYSVPYIISEHMSPFPFANQRQHSFLNKYIIAPIVNAAAVVAVSRHQKKEITHYTKVENTVCIISNIVNIEESIPTANKQNPKVQFVTVGMLNSNAKGIDLLIQAVKILCNKGIKNFTIHVAGGGSLLNELQLLAKAMQVGDFFCWHGLLPHSQILQLIKTSDAYICASRHESFGVAVVEALSFGKPVVGTDCGGTKDTINEKNGILVQNENSEALAQGIDWMLQHLYQFDKKLIIAQTKNKYSPKIIADQYIDIYDSLLNK